jgi:hypothetical protein
LAGTVREGSCLAPSAWCNEELFVRKLAAPLWNPTLPTSKHVARPNKTIRNQKHEQSWSAQCGLLPHSRRPPALLAYAALSSDLWSGSSESNAFEAAGFSLQFRSHGRAARFLPICSTATLKLPYCSAYFQISSTSFCSARTAIHLRRASTASLARSTAFGNRVATRGA